MPILTSPPLIGGTTETISGRVTVEPTRGFLAPDGRVVAAAQAGIVRDGAFFGVTGNEPLELVATPPGVGMKITLHVDEQGTRLRGSRRIERVVSVPDSESVAWDDLVDVLPPVAGDWIVPPWAQEAKDAADAAVQAAADAEAALAEYESLPSLSLLFENGLV